MSNHLRLLCVAFLFGAFAETSHAFDGFGYGFPWFGYGNNGPAAYALGNIPAPPYFALHPPVYYSHITPRSYGRSPFACPCNCHGARVVVASKLFTNPYVPTTPATKTSPSKQSGKEATVAQVPVRMANPFYTQEQGEERIAKAEK